MDLTKKTVPYALVKTEVRARHKDEIVVGKTAHYWADEKDPDSLCSVRSEIELTLAEAVAVADEMNRLLSWMLAPGRNSADGDHAYETWIAQQEARMAGEPATASEWAQRLAEQGDEPLPATDDEWKDRLVEGGA